MKKLSEGSVTSWSPSRLEKFERCPRFMLWDTVEKLCPVCFKGKVMGGYGDPMICNTCGATIEDSPAMARGTEIGLNLELFVTDRAKKLHKEIKHPTITGLASALRSEFKKNKNRVKTELQIVLNEKWEPVSKFDKKAWLRTKLDVLRLKPDWWEVIDWKTGGIDKRTGAVRSDSKYDDQLDIYKVATMAAFHVVAKVRSFLAFVDCGPRFDPLVERGVLESHDYQREQKRWEKRVLPIFKEKKFPPRPGNYCNWCPYVKGKGGPCPY